MRLLKRDTKPVQAEAHPAEATPLSSAASPAPAELENDAIYQNGVLVARVAGPQIDLEAGQIRFEEIYRSEHLLLPDDCEFQGHRILIRKIEYSTKVDRGSEGKGRILGGVTAQILRADGH
ncbi:MAG: hypothetical protein ACRD1N_02590 [Terriglobia bacterium]